MLACILAELCCAQYIELSWLIYMLTTPFLLMTLWSRDLLGSSLIIRDNRIGLGGIVFKAYPLDIPSCPGVILDYGRLTPPISELLL